MGSVRKIEGKIHSCRDRPHKVRQEGSYSACSFIVFNTLFCQVDPSRLRLVKILLTIIGGKN